MDSGKVNSVLISYSDEKHIRKNIHISTRNFSLIIAAGIVFSCWGVISTALLLHVLWKGKIEGVSEVIARPLPSVVGSSPEKATLHNAEALLARASLNQPLAAAKTADFESKLEEAYPGASKLAETVFRPSVTGDLQVDGVRIEKLRVKTTTKGAVVEAMTTNGNGSSYKGIIWMVAEFAKDDGQSYKISSIPLQYINEENDILNTKAGLKIAFKFSKERSFILPGKIAAQDKLKRLAIGLKSDGADKSSIAEISEFSLK